MQVHFFLHPLLFTFGKTTKYKRNQNYRQWNAIIRENINLLWGRNWLNTDAGILICRYLFVDWRNQIFLFECNTASGHSSLSLLTILVVLVEKWSLRYGMCVSQTELESKWSLPESVRFSFMMNYFILNQIHTNINLSFAPSERVNARRLIGGFPFKFQVLSLSPEMYFLSIFESFNEYHSLCETKWTLNLQVLWLHHWKTRFSIWGSSNSNIADIGSLKIHKSFKLDKGSLNLLKVASQFITSGSFLQWIYKYSR